MLLIWPELLEATAVFTRCVMQAGGMSALPMGIPATEVHSALMMLRVSRSEWPSVSADVSAMGRIAAEATCRKAARK